MFTSLVPQICNIKAHFKLKHETKPFEFESTLPPALRHHAVRKGNFTIYRDHEYKKVVFTLFHFSRHVNLTGVRSYTALEEAVKRFGELVNEIIPPANVVIDNSTASGRIWTDGRAYLDISLLKDILRRDEKSSSTLSIRSDFFPGAVLRRKGFSSVIIFSSGKFIIVGGKSPWHIQEAYQRLLAFIRLME